MLQHALADVVRGRPDQRFLPGGTSLMTTARGRSRSYSPMVTPASMDAPAPIAAPSLDRRNLRRLLFRLTMDMLRCVGRHDQSGDEDIVPRSRTSPLMWELVMMRHPVADLRFLFDRGEPAYAVPFPERAAFPYRSRISYKAFFANSLPECRTARCGSRDPAPIVSDLRIPLFSGWRRCLSEACR